MRPESPSVQKERSIRDYTVYEHGCKKSMCKILWNQIQQCIKRIIHHEKVWYTPNLQGWFNISKNNIIYSINSIKKINHMIISVDTEKEFEKKIHLELKQQKKKHTYTEYLS